MVNRVHDDGLPSTAYCVVSSNLLSAFTSSDRPSGNVPSAQSGSPAWLSITVSIVAGTRKGWIYIPVTKVK